MEEVDISELRAIVEAVNQIEVNPTEYLSDNVYRYDSKNQSLSIVEDNGIQILIALRLFVLAALLLEMS